jgi:hypothetical protein
MEPYGALPNKWCESSFDFLSFFLCEVCFRVSVPVTSSTNFPSPPGPGQRQRKSTSPASSEGNGLLFITGNNPADFKKRNVMTQVRKKAMGSYLESEKKPKRDGRRSRLNSDDNDSNGSRASVGSDQLDSTEAIISNNEALKIFRGESRRPGRRPSSPVRSPASSGHGVTPEIQLPFPRSIDIVLASAPMIQPMRVGMRLPYDHTSPSPFQSIGKALDPFRAMFQAQSPRVSVEELKFYCSRAFGTRAMGQHWIPTLVKSPHAFLSTLCIASSHHDAVHNRQIESVQTTALRQEVIHLIHQNILNPQAKTDDFNVIALTQLIVSEIIVGDETSLAYHEKGVEAMVDSRGGLRQLGVNGRLASTLSWVSLQSAVLREAKPRSIYTDFCASKSARAYPPTATIPESPLFAPRGEFRTIERSPRCSSRTHDLLKEIRMMMDLFLHETKNSRQNPESLKSIYKRITSRYPSAAELSKTNVLTASDWIYESIRVTAVILATAIIKRIPLSEALKYAAQTENTNSIYTSSNASNSNESLISPAAMRHDSPLTGFSTSSTYATSPAFTQANPFDFVPSRPSVSSTVSGASFFPPPAAPISTGPNALLTHLKIAIENSDLSECWSDMAGVLLWVSLVVGAASRKSDKVLKKWFSALSVRCSILLCFEHPGPINATLYRMTELVENLSSASSGKETLRRESAGKRRRT